MKLVHKFAICRVVVFAVHTFVAGLCLFLLINGLELINYSRSIDVMHSSYSWVLRMKNHLLRIRIMRNENDSLTDFLNLSPEFPSGFDQFYAATIMIGIVMAAATVCGLIGTLFGICGTTQRNHFVLYANLVWTSGSMAFCIITLIFVGRLNNYWNDADLSQLIQKSQQYDSLFSTPSGKIWDHAQTILRCCGASSYKDWKNSDTINMLRRLNYYPQLNGTELCVPRACCSYKHDTDVDFENFILCQEEACAAMRNDTDQPLKYVQNEGCSDKIIRHFKSSVVGQALEESIIYLFVLIGVQLLAAGVCIVAIRLVRLHVAIVRFEEAKQLHQVLSPMKRF